MAPARTPACKSTLSMLPGVGSDRVQSQPFALTPKAPGTVASCNEGLIEDTAHGLQSQSRQEAVLPGVAVR